MRAAVQRWAVRRMLPVARAALARAAEIEALADRLFDAAPGVRAA